MSELEIVVAAQPPQIDTVRELWVEYWNSIGLPEDFQGFKNESATLPGKYSSPEGRLLLVLYQGKAAGTGAFRPLTSLRCEAKRLYIRPQYRGRGFGKTLLTRLIAEARNAGYHEMYADTLRTMQQALQLYAAFGFVEVGPYSADPTPGAVFLKLNL